METTITTEHKHAESGNSPPTAELEHQIRVVVLNYDRSRRDGVRYAASAGHLLNRLKKEAGHGNWLPALTRVGISERTAQRFMFIARKSAKPGGFDFQDFSSVQQAETAYRAERKRLRDEADAEATEKARLAVEAAKADQPAATDPKPMALAIRRPAPAPAPGGGNEAANRRNRFNLFLQDIERILAKLPEYINVVASNRPLYESQKTPRYTYATLRENLKKLAAMADEL